MLFLVGPGFFVFLYVPHVECKMWTQRVVECVDIEVDVVKLDDSDAAIHLRELLNIHGCFCPDAALKGSEGFCFHFETSTSGCRSPRVVFSVSISDATECRWITWYYDRVKVQ